MQFQASAKETDSYQHRIRARKRGYERTPTTAYKEVIHSHILQIQFLYDNATGRTIIILHKPVADEISRKPLIPFTIAFEYHMCEHTQSTYIFQRLIFNLANEPLQCALRLSTTWLLQLPFPPKPNHTLLSAQHSLPILTTRRTST